MPQHYPTATQGNPGVSKIRETRRKRIQGKKKKPRKPTKPKGY